LARGKEEREVTDYLRTTGRIDGKDPIRKLEETVRPLEGQIPAFIYGDPEVYELEIERIFSRCWLFVAHESEVPEPGDYVTRYMGEQSVVVIRDEDGKVRVFLNMCRHRGMRICRSDQSNTSHLRCPYHGWTYKNTGQLTGVPAQKDAYGKVLDKSRIRLLEARSDAYAGLIFATWDENAVSLDDYLGDMKWYLDFLVGRAPMEVIGPPVRWEAPGNWKVPTENFIGDSYHTMYTHASIVEVGLAPSLRFSRDGYQVYAGNGHGLNLGMPAPSPVFPEELMPTFKERLSEDQYEVLKETKQSNGSVFPNMSLLLSSTMYEGQMVSHTDLTLWLPKGPDKIVIHRWCLAEKDAPDWWKETSRRLFTLKFGSSGIFEQDDSENYEHISQNGASGPTAGGMVLQYISGMDRPEVEDFPGPGQVYDCKFTEASARGFYDHWLSLLVGGGSGGAPTNGDGADARGSEKLAEMEH
jgi:phenylpropionate dioxygenase-like ring-hydroxylating dioxygenase large terminal subunit